MALSTTSVAVVYAVMVETGLNRTDLGKLILTACFVCDLGTVLALGILFANYNLLLVAFGIVTAAVLLLLPSTLRLVLRTFGHPVSGPEVKFIFLLLFALGGLATAARSEAVLPAYLLGSATPQTSWCASSTRWGPTSWCWDTRATRASPSSLSAPLPRR